MVCGMSRWAWRSRWSRGPWSSTVLGKMAREPGPGRTVGGQRDPYPADREVGVVGFTTQLRGGWGMRRRGGHGSQRARPASGRPRWVNRQTERGLGVLVCWASRWPWGARCRKRPRPSMGLGGLARVPGPSRAVGWESVGRPGGRGEHGDRERPRPSTVLGGWPGSQVLAERSAGKRARGSKVGPGARS